MSSLASAASLIISTFDLMQVKAVTSAIRAADIASGGVAGPLGIIEMPLLRTPGDNDSYTGGACGCDRLQPTEPRRVFHPEPRYLPRPVIHPTPRMEKEPAPPAPEQPTPQSPWKSPVQPPWAVLPWMDRQGCGAAVCGEAMIAAAIKQPLYRPDIYRSGSMLDTVA